MNISPGIKCILYALSTTMGMWKDIWAKYKEWVIGEQRNVSRGRVLSMQQVMVIAKL